MPRILIVRLSSLGDIVHASPVVPALRARWPELRIDWLANERWAPLAALIEGVDEVIAVPPAARQLPGVIGRLRARAYAAALDLHGNYRAACLARLSGARYCVGRAAAAARERGAAHLYTHAVMPAGSHIAEMNVSLAAALAAVLGCTPAPAPPLQFPIRLPAHGAGRHLVDALGERGIHDYFVVSPGGGWKSKRWPAERYGALAAELWRRHRLHAVVNLTPDESALGIELARAAQPAAPAIVSPAVAELPPLLAQARLVIGGDTGPVHLAAALGRPVVALFGDTDPRRNGPLPGGRALYHRAGAPSDYLRGNYVRGADYAPAMLSLTLEQVLAAVEEELEMRFIPVPPESRRP